MASNQKQKAAVSALIKIATFEAFLFAAVIGVYFYTENITYLIGGIIMVSLISAPMFFRWAQDHAASMKAKPNSAETPEDNRSSS